MGLDISHLRATTERCGEPFIVSDMKGAEDARLKLADYVTIVTKTKIDWVEVFAVSNMSKAHYTLFASVTPFYNGPHGLRGSFAFKRNADAPQSSPASVVFSNNDREDELLFKARNVGGAGKPTIVSGPLATHSVAEAAIFCDQIGHQGGAVEKLFFDSFAPDEIVVDIDRVRHIRDLTVDEARHDFTLSFVENWNELSSFVYVSW